MNSFLNFIIFSLVGVVFYLFATFSTKYIEVSEIHIPGDERLESFNVKIKTGEVLTSNFNFIDDLNHAKELMLNKENRCFVNVSFSHGEICSDTFAQFKCESRNFKKVKLDDE